MPYTTNPLQYKYIAEDYALITLHGKTKFLVRFKESSPQVEKIYSLAGAEMSSKSASALSNGFSAMWYCPVYFAENITVYTLDKLGENPKFLFIKNKKTCKIYSISAPIYDAKNENKSLYNYEILEKIAQIFGEINHRDDRKDSFTRREKHKGATKNSTGSRVRATLHKTRLLRRNCSRVSSRVSSTPTCGRICLCGCK